ncbi:uncharacterized protein LODBEIA_P23440 [Lodderomyces beijingensis]|uniref:PIPK domain-containing protein n=1 Tax=Lodderomyces beijingensis TaxID=1775926 RepID=A0ABP0ZLP6_9ASCO
MIQLPQNVSSINAPNLDEKRKPSIRGGAEIIAHKIKPNTSTITTTASSSSSTSPSPSPSQSPSTNTTMPAPITSNRSSFHDGSLNHYHFYDHSQNTAQSNNDDVSINLSNTSSKIARTESTAETFQLPLLTSENLKQQEENRRSLLDVPNNEDEERDGAMGEDDINQHRSPSTPTSFKGSRSEVSDLSRETTPSSVDNGEPIEPSQMPILTMSREVETPSGSKEFQFRFKQPSDARRRSSLDVDPLSQLSHSNQSNTDNSTIRNVPLEPTTSQSGRQQPQPQPPHMENYAISTGADVISTQPLTGSAAAAAAAAALEPFRKPTSSRRHTTPTISTSPARDKSTLRKENNSKEKPSIRPHHHSHHQHSHNRSEHHPLLSSAIKSSSHCDLPRSTSGEMRKMRDSITGKNHRVKKRFTEDEKVLVGNKISEGHDNFVMAYNMLTGIRVAVSSCSGVMRQLTDQDFVNTKKLSFNFEGNELTPSSKYDFKFKDYCPEVFRELRQIFGIDPADYLISITGKYILSELGSPGKSGSFFYYSRDYRFIIKTIHHSEKKQLLRMLQDYYQHVKENPNILLSQFYGLHRVKMPMFGGGRTRKVHFVVMNNLFPPHRDIHLKFDLKGSTWGRVTRVEKEDAEAQDFAKYTLKDINWLEMHEQLKFGPDKRNVFLKQLEKDVKLLQKANVMDYSLLLGIHDVKRGNSTDMGQKLSVFEPKSSDKSAIINTNPRDIDRSQDLPSSVYPGRSKYIFYGHDGGIRATDVENAPLQEIYYLGIIDFLTNYGLKKRLETCWRSLTHSRATISAIPAKEYGDRFRQFIKTGTTSEKQKKS